MEELSTSPPITYRWGSWRLEGVRSSRPLNSSWRNLSPGPDLLSISVLIPHHCVWKGGSHTWRTVRRAFPCHIVLCWPVYNSSTHRNDLKMFHVFFYISQPHLLLGWDQAIISDQWAVISEQKHVRASASSFSSVLPGNHGRHLFWGWCYKL